MSLQKICCGVKNQKTKWRRMGEKCYGEHGPRIGKCLLFFPHWLPRPDAVPLIDTVVFTKISENIMQQRKRALGFLGTDNEESQYNISFRPGRL